MFTTDIEFKWHLHAVKFIFSYVYLVNNTYKTFHEQQQQDIRIAQLPSQNLGLISRLRIIAVTPKQVQVYDIRKTGYLGLFVTCFK